MDYAESKVEADFQSALNDPSVFPAAATAAAKRRGVLGVDNEQVDGPRESLLQYQEPEIVADQKPSTKKKGLAAVDTKKTHQLIDILNAILPPREYVDPRTQQLMRQCVSAIASSREEVIALQMKLDQRLQERQARESGICPVREELYSQCFDEIIRQVTIDSPERGLLLVRLRDEIRMSIAAYQTLYGSSITFGLRKSMQAEQGGKEIKARLEALEEEKKRIQAQVQEAKQLYEAMEKRITEQKALEEKKMQEEKEFLKFQAQHLESFLKSAVQ